MEEVIQQGTGVLSKQMTHGDLTNKVNSRLTYLSHSTKAVLKANYQEATIAGPTPATPIEPEVEFSAIDGVRLLPSDNPEEKTFTIQIGRPTSDNIVGPKLINKSDSLSAKDMEEPLWDEDVILYDENGVQVKVHGTIDLEILLDVGVSYGIISGLEDFRFVPTVKTTENLELTITGEAEGVWEKPVASIPFGDICFFVGPVPVWISFQLDVSVGGDIHVTAEATTGASLEQTITAGVHYKKSTGFDSVKNLRKSWTFDEPNLEAELMAKAFVKPTGKVLFYSATGPAVFVEPYLELRGQLASEDTLVNSCLGGINFSSRFGLKSDFYWDFPGDTKLGKFLNLDDLEKSSTFNIIEKEWTISRWNYGGECGLKAPSLEVVGPHLCETLTHGSGEVISQDYILRNEK